jgi:hypothetical protein
LILAKARRAQSITPDQVLDSRHLFEKLAAEALRAVHPDYNGGIDGGVQNVLTARNAIRKEKGWG